MRVGILGAGSIAGGSLLDLTVYPLNFASMVWVDDYTRMEAFCAYTDTGVDGQDTVSLFYPDGRTASLFTTIYSATDRRGMIYGTNGYIEVININNPEKIIVFVNSNNRPFLYKEYSIPEQISGYEYEVLSCKKAMEEGNILKKIAMIRFFVYNKIVNNITKFSGRSIIL